MSLSPSDSLALIDRGQGPTIVWIHGFPHSGALFQRQLSIPGVRHIIPDLPGFGRTPPRPLFTMDEFAETVVAGLERHGVQQAIFAGVSMGGYVVMSILRSAPRLVSGLILIATRASADSDEARRARLDTAEKVRSNGTSALVESMLPKMLTAAGLQDRLLREEVRSMMISATPEGAASALLAMAARPASRDILAASRVPALLMFGEEDTIITDADRKDMESTMTSATSKVVPRAAHLPNLEQPADFNRSVEEMLQRYAGRFTARLG